MSKERASIGEIICFLACVFLIGILPNIPTDTSSKFDGMSFGTGYTIVAKLHDLENRPRILRYPADLAWEHERYVFLGLRLWGSPEGEYVLLAHRGKTTLASSISLERAKAYASSVGVTLPDAWPISTLSLYGGWIALLIPVLAYMGFHIVMNRYGRH